MKFLTLTNSLIVEIDRGEDSREFEDAEVAKVIGTRRGSNISVGSRVLLRRLHFSALIKYKFGYKGKTYYEILPEHVICVLLDD